MFFVCNLRDIAENLITEGEQLYNLGRYEEALQCYTEAATTFQDLYGENHPDVVAALYGRGIALRKLGRLQEALHCLTKVEQLTREGVGDYNPALAIILRSRAVVLLALGQPKEALSDLREALNIFVRYFGSNHAEVLKRQQIILAINVFNVVLMYYRYCKILFPDPRE